MQFTAPFVDGDQESTLRSERTWARFACGMPPTWAKTPPMYQPPAPSESEQSTMPSTCGAPASRPRSDVRASAPPPVSGPTQRMEPETKSVSPEIAEGWPMALPLRVANVGNAGSRGAAEEAAAAARSNQPITM